MESDRKYYVLLTGSKNNAGDFLIKKRAKSLLDYYRSDRDYVDMDGWKPLDSEQLNVINGSEALILTGGPSLQPGTKIEDNIYPFIKSLDDIKVPIYTMGVGYKGIKGTWEENSNYEFSQTAFDLLKRIQDSGGKSSVRDYHTLDILQKKGFNNFIMTGCPALYNTKDTLKPITDFQINRIGFSLGVSYKLNTSMRKLMEQLILKASSFSENSRMTVFLHHKINPNDKAQSQMIKFLEEHKIDYVDISGTAEKLMSEYEKCDIHLGFRVHAHIFCSSMGIPSVLLSEDGRAIALKEVLNGLIFRAHYISGNSFFTKVFNRLRLVDRIVSMNGLVDTVFNSILYENKNGSLRFNQAFYNIDKHKKKMEYFISQLP